MDVFERKWEYEERAIMTDSHLRQFGHVRKRPVRDPDKNG